MPHEQNSRSGQKCLYCEKPLRKFSADDRYGYKWNRKYHKKCIKDVEFEVRLREQMKEYHFPYKKCNCFLCKLDKANLE